MSNLGKLTAYLEADHSNLLKGMRESAHAIEGLQRKTQALTQQLKVFENAAAKAGQAMSHAFKASDISGHGRKVTDAVNSYSASATGAAGASGLLSSSWAQAGASAFIFLGMVHRVTAALSEAFQLIESSARTAMAEQFFLNAGKSLQDFRGATQGLISDAQLMKKANLADSMGIDEDTFKSLANVAHAASLKTGQSFDYMFNSIIVGTARSSRLLLDNLGIIVSVKEANERWAASNNKVVESMTDLEKKQAFAQEVTRQSAGMMDEYNAITDKSADNFDRLKAAIEDFKTELGRLGSATAGPIGEVAKGLKEIADRMADIRKFGNANVTAEGIRGTIRGSLAGGALGSALMGPLGMAVGSTIGGVGEGASSTSDAAIDARFAAEAEFGALIKFIKDEGLDLRDALAIDTDSFRDLGPGVADAIKRFQELNKALDNLIKPIVTKKKTDDFGGDGGGAGAVDKRKAHNPEYFSDGGWLAQFNAELRKGVEEVNEGLTEEAQMRRKRAQEMDLALRNAKDEYKKAMAAEQAAREEFARQMQEQINQGAFSALGSASKGDASGFITALGTALGATMGAPQAGAAIADFLAPLLEKFKPIADLFVALAQGFEQLIIRGLEPLTAAFEPVAQALFGLIVVFGELTASILRPFASIISFTVGVLALTADVLTALFVVVSPLIEIFASLAATLFGMIVPLGNMLGLFREESTPLAAFMQAVENVGNTILDVAIFLNNAIVSIIRGIGDWADETFGDDFGLSGFGKELSRQDFEMETVVDALEDNTDKTKENTEAVRDLTREFRNLPQGYKINYAIYEETFGGRRPDPGQLAGAGVRDNFRTRL